MKDTIYKQDAIDAIYKAFSYAYCDNCENGMNEDLCQDCYRKYQNWSASKKTVEKVINNLPSAEPEIIRCKDCKWSEIDDPDFPDQYFCHADGDSWNKGDHWCSYAEKVKG